MFVDIAHIALQVPDVEAVASHYRDVLGLRDLDRRDDALFLTHGSDRPCLQFIEGPALAFDHMAFEVRDDAALEELGARLSAAGVDAVTSDVDEPGVDAALRFEGPRGHLYEAIVAQPPSHPAAAARILRGEGYVAAGVRPNRLGHVTLQTSDVAANTEFMTSVLGFRVSDVVGDEPWMVFGRCNNDHHALAYMLGRDALHHFAFEVSSVGELARLGDTLYEAGRQILWGPGRHGAGDNIAMYHQDPAGVIVEYYTDMQRVFDDRWEPRHWKLDDYRFNNVWGGPMPDADLIDAVVPCAAPAGRV